MRRPKVQYRREPGQSLIWNLKHTDPDTVPSYPNDAEWEDNKDAQQPFVEFVLSSDYSHLLLGF